MIGLCALVLAGEHDRPEVEKIDIADVAIPDGPPQERTAAPNEDLAALIATLPAGSTLRLPPGSYTGPLLVDRPLTLIGAPGAVLDGQGKGSVLILAAPDTVVQGLHVTNGGFQHQDDDAGVVVGADRIRLDGVTIDRSYLGIDLRMSKNSVVQNCVIRGDTDQPMGMRGDGIRLWESFDNVVEHNRLDGVRDLVIWYSDRNIIRENLVTQARYGTHLMHASDNRIEGNVYDQDVVGIFVMYSTNIVLTGNTVVGAHGQAGVGIGLKESDELTITYNRLLDDTTGIYLDSSPHRSGGRADIEGNLIAGNEVGLRLHGRSRGARFLANRFEHNGVQVTADGGNNALDLTFSGNLWSDYTGYDLDRDGVGDLPYAPVSLSGTVRARKPELSFFAGTPAMALLDLFIAAFPMFAPKPLLTDLQPALELP